MASYPTEVCTGGIDTWTPLQTNVLSDATQCGGDDEKWQVLVGAPGYAVAGAVYCFQSRRPFFGSTKDMLRGMGPTCTEHIRE